MAAKHPIRFGVQTGQQSVEWATMLDLWQKADAWGYDSLWNFDHFYPIFVDPEGPCFEGWTTLSALAQATKRARIGHLVNGNTYRHPCLTAKMAATLASGRMVNFECRMVNAPEQTPPAFTIQHSPFTIRATRRAQKRGASRGRPPMAPTPPSHIS
jgi:luciferase-like monooxygenase